MVVNDENQRGRRHQGSLGLKTEGKSSALMLSPPGARWYRAVKKEEPALSGGLSKMTTGADGYRRPWLLGTKTVQVFVLALPAASRASTVMV